MCIGHQGAFYRNGQFHGCFHLANGFGIDVLFSVYFEFQRALFSTGFFFFCTGFSIKA
jgi:hypothetical protein